MGREPRSFEGHMEWEFSDRRGPLDPHSPFTQLSQQKVPVFTSSFATPSKVQTKPKQPQPQQLHPDPPSSSTFSPQVAAGPSRVAPPFRNPAFVTPRKPLNDDEPQLSEMSGVEDSPGVRTDDPSDCADTPELDRLADLDMRATASASSPRIDKSLRYRKYRQNHAAALTSSARRLQMSGRGEIARHPRDFRFRDVVRKRKRHAHDADVAAAARDYSDDDSDGGLAGVGGRDVSPRRISGRRALSGRGSSGGVFASVFSAMEEHPDAPENLARWGAVVMNMAAMCGILCGAYYILDALRSDVFLASHEEQATIGSKIAACVEQYRSNKCGDGPLPALRGLCAEWFDCMNQSPHAVKRFQLMVRQAAEAINVFSGTMHMRGWAMFFCALILWLYFTSRASGGGHSATARVPVPDTPKPSHFPHAVVDAAGLPPLKLFPPPQTPPPPPPRRRAMALDYEDDLTDTDVGSSPPPDFQSVTPGRRSPSKGERSRSASQRSPSKHW